MSRETAVVAFYRWNADGPVDLEIPLFLSAGELAAALNEAYGLGIDASDVKNHYLKAENPIAFLRGSRTLAEYGIHDGSEIYFTKRGENDE